MSQSPAGETPAAAKPAASVRYDVSFFATVIGATVLAAVAIWIFDLGVLWALAGLLGLRVVGLTIAALVLVPPAIWATGAVAVLAWKAERTLREQAPQT
ncbi:hypothetical protein [Polymorphum gilvum]|uniref:Uncharacterized protein n=1 Tax=Polymorphum gilvum (strain LMG 25793 / CGMCC 1.9160 / SL003B-26A1) TaxID=991905 RepID=F2J376_POLGS|nr:hypothetical protein [Polymorphum gilvum]ADZ69883.1 hypothetical protein SL003B_1455 [Polymorphum gilvum SL003B-26A1]